MRLYRAALGRWHQMTGLGSQRSLSRRREPLKIGDRIRACGGYDMEPAWLQGKVEGYVGTVIGFLPEPGSQPASVVLLDKELVIPVGAGAARETVAGKLLVLTLGHSNTDWAVEEPRIHVELCNFEPTIETREAQRHGAWVDSPSTYLII